MLYTIFMRKTKGDRSPFAIYVALKNYIKTFGKNDIVIAIPGYMSNKTETINNFLSSIQFPTKTYFAVGMNGSVKITSTNESVQQTHNKKFSLNNISGFKTINQDHAKMMFFLEDNPNINLNDAHQLLSLNVKAVLIGSSNQSNTTYLNPTADKGEADLFLINGDYLKHTKNMTNVDNEILKFYQLVLEEYYQADQIENKAIDHKENSTNNVALFKEFNKDTTLNLNEILKEAIKGLLE